ncbi:MAG TPA: autotransporter assembly complex family protein [Cellvibrio sp.]|nr:autotransporter assembly complex family protein [Cellvibrio sp.]
MFSRSAASLSRSFLLLACAFLSQPGLAQAETVPQILIEGGPGALRENIRQYLTIDEEGCAAPIWRLQSLLGDARREMAQAAQALGYYRSTFTTRLTEEKGCWQLHIAVTPGEQVKITAVNYIIHGDGGNDRSFKELRDNSSVKVGEPLNHGNYETLKNRMAALASSHGYFDGRFEVSTVRVNAVNSTAEVELIYDSGRRYRFGDIRITHNILDEGFLRRYLAVKEGDYYDTDTLLELKNLYNQSNYFNVATASPDIQHLEDYQVPIDIVLEERKRRAYSAGLGAATDTGARVLLGFEDRYVNDSGHSIVANFNASKVTMGYELAYVIPMKRPAFEHLKLLNGYEKEETDTSYSNKRTIGANYTYQRNRWLQTYAINFENESSRIGDNPYDKTNLIIPSLTLLRTKIDGSPYPLQGWTLTGTLSGSPKTFGSDVSFLQFYSRLKYIVGLPVGRVLFRTEIGATQVNDFDLLPASKRYFAGGDTSVRGYAYESLGPVDDTGKVVGGNNLLVSSIEYDFLFRPKWAAAAFFDIGNAADDFDADLKSSAGLGVRWISPVGPVRLDFAQPLNDDKGWQIRFTMGPDL